MALSVLVLCFSSLMMFTAYCWVLTEERNCFLNSNFVVLALCVAFSAICINHQIGFVDFVKPLSKRSRVVLACASCPIGLDLEQ
jgi:hypothetical protein